MSKGTDTRERIVDYALRNATRDSLAGVTLGRLAAELGLSKSGLYAHFDSKEALQVEVLNEASRRFQARVVQPALRAPRGRPRIEALFEGWLAWLSDPELPGGCVFVAATAELDDQEGRPREVLVTEQARLMEFLAHSARLAINAGHFRPTLDPAQFAFDCNAIVLAYNFARRLLRDPQAAERARRAFQRLLEDAAAAA